MELNWIKHSDIFDKDYPAIIPLLLNYKKNGVKCIGTLSKAQFEN